MLFAVLWVAALMPAQSRPQPAYAPLVTAVLKARCADVADDARHPTPPFPASDKQTMAALDAIIRNRTPNGDEVLAVLLSYSLGEKPGLRVSGEIINRGRRMIPAAG
jgi:hypothetical protein